VDYDPIEAQPRWQPWPKLQDGRARDQLLAENASLRPIADRSAPRERVIEARKRIAQNAWQLYLMGEGPRMEGGYGARLPHLEACVKALAAIIRDFPDSVTAHDDATMFRLAVVVRAVGDDVRARAVLLRIIGTLPDNRYFAAAWTLFGLIHAERGEHTTAARFYVHSLRVPARNNGVSAYTRYLLARSLFQVGLLAEGKRALRESVADAQTLPTQHGPAVADAASAMLARLGDPPSTSSTATPTPTPATATEAATTAAPGEAESPRALPAPAPTP
jgi:hypothetical protein